MRLPGLSFYTLTRHLNYARLLSRMIRCVLPQRIIQGQTIPFIASEGKGKRQTTPVCHSCEVNWLVIGVDYSALVPCACRAMHGVEFMREALHALLTAVRE